jgi:hypothetical protein
MEKPFIEINAGNVYLGGYNTKPIDGYIEPENFPLCCPYHQTIFENVKKWHDKFPSCCEPHKELFKKSWFNKNLYTDLPLKIVRQSAFTEYHIEKRINTPNWFEDIVFYIEYNEMSFGHPAIGLHNYFGVLKERIQRNKNEFPVEKQKRLLNFIEGYYKESTLSGFDPNLLFDHYQKWLGIFPFEISYFSELKKKFESQLPFAVGPAVVNPYSGLAKVKAQTVEGLIDSLNKMTITLLSNVRSKDLFEKGIIPNLKEHAIKLVNEAHRVKQATLFTQFSKNESQYVKLLEKWLFNEKEYFKELSSIITYKSDDKKKIITFPDLFEDEAKYERILNLLVEKGYCQADTFIWKDETNGNKGFLVAILKHLHKLKYYKGNQRPTSQQIKEIAKDTFGLKISLDTIKRARPDQFDVSFIPPA